MEQTLDQRRKRLRVRLDMIRNEQGYGVWRGGEEEPKKLERAIAKIDRKTKKPDKE